MRKVHTGKFAISNMKKECRKRCLSIHHSKRREFLGTGKNSVELGTGFQPVKLIFIFSSECLQGNSLPPLRVERIPYSLRCFNLKYLTAIRNIKVVNIKTTNKLPYIPFHFASLSFFLPLVCHYFRAWGSDKQVLLVFYRAIHLYGYILYHCFPIYKCPNADSGF